MPIYAVIWAKRILIRFEQYKELISWLNSRKGLPEGANGNVLLKLEDIRKDAEKVRPYDSVWDMYYDEFEELEVV